MITTFYIENFYEMKKILAPPMNDSFLSKTSIIIQSLNESYDQDIF